MSNIDKSWPFARHVGGALGSGIALAGSAAVVAAFGLVGTPVVVIGIAAAMGGGLLGGVMGDILDDDTGVGTAFRSAMLYNIVVCGLISSLLFAMTLDHMAGQRGLANAGFYAIAGLSGFLSAMSRALLNDVIATLDRRRGLPR